MSTLTFDNFPKIASVEIGKTVSADTVARTIATAILGLVGLAILYPFLLPLRAGLLFKSRTLYKRISKDATAVYNEIHKMSEAELMSIHLHYEFYKNDVVPELKKLENILAINFPTSYIAKQVVNYLGASSQIIIDVEKDLKSTVYPDIDQPLSKEQLEELANAYKGISCEDWDEIGDEYKRAYFD